MNQNNIIIKNLRRCKYILESHKWNIFLGITDDDLVSWEMICADKHFNKTYLTCSITGHLYADFLFSNNFENDYRNKINEFFINYNCYFKNIDESHFEYSYPIYYIKNFIHLLDQIESCFCNL